MNTSVIIPAHNEEKYIGDCLENLLKNMPDDILEIIVVDNASTDRTSEVAGKFSKVKVFFEPNKGSNFARQRGFLESGGDLLAYIDADVRVPKNWFDIIHYEFSKNKELICLSGPCEYFDIPEWKRIFIKSWWNFLVFPTYMLTGYMIAAGNFAVKKESLSKIGGFNTDITFYGDDADTARRLSKIGKIKFSPSFVAYTSGRRLVAEGFLKTGAKYVVNYLSVAIFKRPVIKSYKNIR